MSNWPCECGNQSPLQLLFAPPFHAGVQDERCEAWLRLQEYIAELGRRGAAEFSLFDAVGAEGIRDIITLPREIGEVQSLVEIDTYGSLLQWLPPEIGNLRKLSLLDTYTTYTLHWYPHELTRCGALSSSRVSTRALYGNYKYRPPFPSLRGNPMAFYGPDRARCAGCGGPVPAVGFHQYWISQRVGTDVLPLLAHACSPACIELLGPGADGYLERPHRGGIALRQPAPR